MSNVKLWTPIIVFFVIITCTHLIGLFLFLFGPDFYWKLTYMFTGTTLPDVYMDDLYRILALTAGSLIALCLGFYAALRLPFKNNDAVIFPEGERNLLGTASVFIFWLLVMYCLWRLFSFQNLADIKNWLTHPSFVRQRFLVFSELQMRDLIIIYSFVPMFMCLSFIALRKQRSFIHIILQLAALTVINLYIFQKRPLAEAIILLILTWFYYNFMGKKPRAKISWISIVALAGGILLIYLIYVGGIYAGTLMKPKEQYISATEKVELEKYYTEDKGGETISFGKKVCFKSFELKPEYLSVSKFVFVNAMAFVGMINRTSFAGITYPVVFPKYIDYFHLDLGLDMFGYGEMPDDALQIYAILNPNRPEGSMAAPFYIVLYSQGGLAVAFGGSFLLAFGLGIVWRRLSSTRQVSGCTAVMMALVILFVVHLALSNARNAFISGYGLVWPAIVLSGGYYMHSWMIRRRRAAGSPRRVCMLVTSGVVNDSRIIREASAASGSGCEVLMLGRCFPELGPTDPGWNFQVKLLDISRAEGKGVVAKIIERSHIGLRLTLETIRFRPDIVHCNDFDTLPFGALAALVNQSALVYDSHEIWSGGDLTGRHKIGSFIIQKAEGFIARRCDAVISVSHSAGEWLQKQYHLNNLHIVTNCPAAFTGQFPDKPEAFELLIHGMYAPDRGYEEAIDAAALVAGDGLNIRLRGYGKYTPLYRARAEETGQPNIIFSDKVPSEEVVRATAASHVGLALTRPVSLNYCLTVSNKIFEYMAAGLPVIMNDAPEHLRLNERYDFGIVLKELSAEAVAEAALTLKRDAKLYARLSENARKASQVMCWENESQKLMALYEAAFQKTVPAPKGSRLGKGRAYEADPA